MKILLKTFFFIGLVFVFLYFYGKNLLLLTVPSNKHFFISKEIPIEQVIPDEKRRDYEKTTFDFSNPKWMKLCLEGIMFYDEITNEMENDYSYLCRNFSKGYLRRYHHFIFDNQEINGNDGLAIYVLEFNSPKDVKNAASYHTLEVVLPKFSMNELKIIGTKGIDPKNNFYMIPFPHSNKLISLKGNRLAIEEVVKTIVDKYKKH